MQSPDVWGTRSHPVQGAMVSNTLRVEVPPLCIALCAASGVNPQAALRGMVVTVCGLQYGAQNRLVSPDGVPASWPDSIGRRLPPDGTRHRARRVCDIQ